MRGVNFSWRLRKLVWKLEREKSKRREHGGKSSCGEIVRDFLTKLHSNYFRAVITCIRLQKILIANLFAKVSIYLRPKMSVVVCPALPCNKNIILVWSKSGISS